MLPRRRAGGRGMGEMEAGEVPPTDYAREREERARRVWGARQVEGVVVVDEKKSCAAVRPIFSGCGT